MSYLLNPPNSDSGYSPSAPGANPGYVPSSPYTPSTAATGYATGSYTPSSAAMSMTGYSPYAAAAPAPYTPSYPQQQYQQPVYNNNYYQPQPQQQQLVATGAATTSAAIQIEVCVVEFGKKVKVDMEVDPTDTLDDVKEMAADEIGIPPHLQLVKFNDKEIHDSHLTLQQLGIVCFSRLVVSKKDSGPILTVVLHQGNPTGTQTFPYRAQRLDLELDFQTATLGDVRNRVCQQTQIPADRQQIKFNNKTLDSSHLTLHTLHFKDGAELLVYHKEKPSAVATIKDANTQAAAAMGGGGSDLASLKVEFDKLDRDKSGYIDASELKKAFKWAPASLVKMAMGHADTNRDGRIDFQEYCKIRNQLGKTKVPNMSGKKKK